MSHPGAGAVVTANASMQAAAPPTTRRAAQHAGVPAGVTIGAVCMLVLVCASLAFAVFRPVQVLPLLHPAPPVTLLGADGAPIALARLGGTIVVFQVSALRCAPPCADGHEAFLAVQQRLAAASTPVPVRLVTVVLDGDGRPQALGARRAALGADSRWWQLATGDATQLKNIVGAGFGVYYTQDRDGRIAFDPATILVDERGIVRADYRTAALSGGLLWRDIGLVAREAVSRGAGRMLYGAAHLFLCYPRSALNIGG